MPTTMSKFSIYVPICVDLQVMDMHGLIHKSVKSSFLREYESNSIHFSGKLEHSYFIMKNGSRDNILSKSKPDIREIFHLRTET